jgi:hypothetical protein
MARKEIETKPVLVYIGKKAPKGFKELSGGIHLGGGIWILKIEKIKETE